MRKHHGVLAAIPVILLAAQPRHAAADAFCPLMQKIDAQTMSAFASLKPGSTDEQITTAIAQSTRGALDRTDALEREAPDEVKADLHLMLEAYRKFETDKEALEANGAPAASLRLEHWLKENCNMKYTDD